MDPYNSEHNRIYEIINVPETTGVMFRTSVDSGSYVPAHYHQALEIIYLLEGSLDVFVEKENIRLDPGDCVIININAMHFTKCTRPNKAILLQIPLKFLELYIPNVRQLHFSVFHRTADRRQETKLDMFRQTLTQMQIADDIRPEGFLLRFNSLLFELMFQLLHNFSVQVMKANLPQQKKDMDRLNDVLDYISLHYKEPVSLDEIARTAFLQPRYFCRFFKKHVGVTFLEYQNEVRLSHIYQDLLQTDDEIRMILERHGFTNYKLFRRMFREHFGDTPTKIRAGYHRAGNEAPH